MMVNSLTPQVQYQNRTQFTDSRDLSRVSLPYFIQVLDDGDNNLGYLRNPNVWQGYGHGANISYAFADSPNFQNDKKSFTVTGFRQYSEQQKRAIKQAFDVYSTYTKLRFQEVSPNGYANFRLYLDDLNNEDTYTDNYSVQSTELCPCCAKKVSSISDQEKPLHFVGGYAYRGGDVHLNSQVFAADNAFDKDNLVILNDFGGYTQGGFGTVLHELGHSVGLDHPFDGKVNIPKGSSEDKVSLTMMSYQNDLNQYLPQYDAEFNVTATQFGLFDLAALHYRYGVNENQNSGNDTYYFKDFRLKDSSGRHVLGNDIYIWDGAGLDTFDGSNQTQDLHINLTPGSWIWRGRSKTPASTLVYDKNGNVVKDQMFIGFGTQIENLYGGSGHDELTGNETNNHIKGNAGNDVIHGGNGNDWLEGGAGNDTLNGGEGDDILMGQAGNNTLNGGNGNDIYYVESTGDRITDTGGNDTVYSSLKNYRLPQGIENLVTVGGNRRRGLFSLQPNTLTGNELGNTLKGSEDNDVYAGKEGADTFVFGANFGNDTVDNRGRGKDGDVMRFEAANLSQTNLSRQGQDLLVAMADGGSRVVVKDWFAAAGNNTVSEMQFADGQSLQAAQINAMFANRANHLVHAMAAFGLNDGAAASLTSAADDSSHMANRFGILGAAV